MHETRVPAPTPPRPHHPQQLQHPLRRRQADPAVSELHLRRNRADWAREFFVRTMSNLARQPEGGGVHQDPWQPSPPTLPSPPQPSRDTRPGQRGAFASPAKRFGTKPTCSLKPVGGWPAILSAWVWFLACNLYLGHLTSAHAGVLSYDARRATLTANAKQLPLRELLEELAAQTGWKVYVDPALEHTVSSRFDHLPAGEALQRLLRGLNFSLSPSGQLPPELVVYTGSAASATLLVNPASAEELDLLPEEWVIRLKPGTDASIQEIARRYGATVVGKVEGSDIYRLRFEDADAASRARPALEADPQIDAIEHNYVARPPHQTAGSPQALLPPLSLAPKPLNANEGVIVALLDTAVATDSPVLKDFLLPTVEVTESVAAAPETLTHGTAMAETLLRSLAMHSPEPGSSTVRILPVDIYGGRPTTSTFDIVNGLLVAAQSGARVINLSLGGDGASPLLAETVRMLSHHGVLVIAAAGNTPSATSVFPAAYPEVLAVTAADPHGNVAPYANYGDFVDLLGPGTSLVQHENRVYRGTGTSYATAHISGAAAAYLSIAGSTPAAVDHALRQSYGYRAPTVAP